MWKPSTNNNHEYSNGKPSIRAIVKYSWTVFHANASASPSAHLLRIGRLGNPNTEVQQGHHTRTSLILEN
jgi:hypothetical protein